MLNCEQINISELNIINFCHPLKTSVSNIWPKTQTVLCDTC